MEGEMGGNQGTHLRDVLFYSMLLVLMTSCSTAPPAPSPASPVLYDRFVLMPDAAGKVGEIVITNKGGSQVLSKAFQETEVTDLNTVPSHPIVFEESQVTGIFNDALAAEPESPVRYILYFYNASKNLTNESLRLVPQILATIQARNSTWIGVVGHTDRVGWRQDNYALSLSRAEAVRDILMSKGVDAGFIQIGSHGEDNVLIWTDDEVPEPRNRRVEVTIR
jgi:outer membrane protein OmpA-like peptidoglycan-associated protein